MSGCPCGGVVYVWLDEIAFLHGRRQGPRDEALGEEVPQTGGIGNQAGIIRLHINHWTLPQITVTIQEKIHMTFKEHLDEKERQRAIELERWKRSAFSRLSNIAQELAMLFRGGFGYLSEDGSTVYTWTFDHNMQQQMRPPITDIPPSIFQEIKNAGFLRHRESGGWEWPL